MKELRLTRILIITFLALVFMSNAATSYASCDMAETFVQSETSTPCHDESDDRNQFTKNSQCCIDCIVVNLPVPDASPSASPLNRAIALRPPSKPLNNKITPPYRPPIFIS